MQRTVRGLGFIRGPPALLQSSLLFCAVQLPSNPSKFHTSHPLKMSEGKFPVVKTEAEWKKQLSAEEYEVLRNKGTERPGKDSEYNKHYPKEGFYKCRACGNPLYSYKAKFDSGCGWPAFDKCYQGAIKTNVDESHGMKRIEIVCSQCGGHLGHVFEGEKFTDTNTRHCVNSVSVKYDKGAAPKKEEVNY
eukprot:g36726.t1